MEEGGNLIFDVELFDLLLFWRIAWTVILNYLDFGMPFVLFIFSNANIGKNPFLVSL
jgi:hypothetical protein